LKETTRMDFAINQNDGTAVIKVNVEKLNASNAAGLKAELVLLNKNNVNNIVIDMATSKYCDSSGLSAILVANRLCKDTNGKFVLCGLQPNVEKLISIAQLDKVLSIADNEEAALALI
jgi:anti-anti-sigma factor